MQLGGESEAGWRALCPYKGSIRLPRCGCRECWEIPDMFGSVSNVSVCLSRIYRDKSPNTPRTELNTPKEMKVFGPYQMVLVHIQMLMWVFRTDVDATHLCSSSQHSCCMQWRALASTPSSHPSRLHVLSFFSLFMCLCLFAIMTMVMSAYSRVLQRFRTL